MIAYRVTLIHVIPFYKANLRLASSVSEERIKQCYRILNVPLNSNQDTVRKAFIELAKRYHPDSGSDYADIKQFCEIEDAFRIITKKNTGGTAELETVHYDIKHTAPQHRQYLSFEGIGHGSPMQREKQYIQIKAQKAAENVTEHRISKALASENSLLKKDDVKKKHDIKTQYGFDRLVEDLIQEAMSKGEFDNLSGNGKPLKGQNYNPYVDFTTHKLNEVLINNGFTPEWIMLNKDIKEEIVWMKNQLARERAKLGPVPLTTQEEERWKTVCKDMGTYTKGINSKILSFNLQVPIMNKQLFLLKFEDIADDVLKNGQFRELDRNIQAIDNQKERKVTKSPVKESEMLLDLFLSSVADACSLIFKAFKKNK